MTVIALWGSKESWSNREPVSAAMIIALSTLTCLILLRSFFNFVFKTMANLQYSLLRDIDKDCIRQLLYRGFVIKMSHIFLCTNLFIHRDLQKGNKIIFN